MKKLITVIIFLFGTLSYSETRIVFPGDIEKRKINGEVRR